MLERLLCLMDSNKEKWQGATKKVTKKASKQHEGFYESYHQDEKSRKLMIKETHEQERSPENVTPEDEGIYLTPQHLLDDKVRMDHFRAKWQRASKKVVKKTRQEQQAVYKNERPGERFREVVTKFKQEHGRLYESSKPKVEDLNLASKPVLGDTFPYNSHRRVVPKKPSSVIDSEDDTVDGSYARDKIESSVEEETETDGRPTTSRSSRSTIKVCRDMFGWRCRRPVAVICMLCTLFIVTGVVVFIYMKGNLGNYYIS